MSDIRATVVSRRVQATAEVRHVVSAKVPARRGPKGERGKEGPQGPAYDGGVGNLVGLYETALGR